jgi:hypothetical protein
MMYADYDPQTGQILQLSSHPRDGASQIEVADNFNDAAHYVSGGAFLPFPSSPSKYHSWDWSTKAWVDQRSLAEVKAAQWELLKIAAKAANEADITVQNVTFKADAETRSELMQEALVAQMSLIDGQAYTLDWDRANGNDITLTASQVKALVRAMNNRTVQIRAALRTKRQAVESASTIAEVQAIEW